MPSLTLHETAVAPADTLSRLDLRGLVCPLPVLRTKRAIRDLPPGATLEVLVSDPAAVIDFPCFCHHAGLELLQSQRQGELLTFIIRKPAAGLLTEC